MVVVVAMGATCLFAKLWLVILVWLAYCVGVGVTAADAAVNMDPNQYYHCYMDTWDITQNKTFFYDPLNGFSQRKCGRIVKPSDSKCGATTDWNTSWPYPDDYCLPYGATPRTHDMHLYCGRKYTYHALNYPFCMAFSCANVSDSELDLAIQSTYIPYFLQDTESRGFHCSISLSPRTNGWWWQRYGWKWMLLPVTVVSLGTLLCWYRWRRAKLVRNVDGEGVIVCEVAPTIDN
jgi:hypothetical protein